MTLMPLLLSAVLTFPDEPFDMAPLEMHEFPSREFRITDFGARAGDGSKSTEAIASAVEACVAAGGGRVVVPEGRFFTGNVRLRSGVELHLEDGAVLEFSDDPADYLPSVPVSWEGVECRGYAPLVYAYGCTNVAITGNGTLTARMDRWMEWATLYRDNSLALLQTMLKWGRDGVPVEKRDLTAYPTGGKRPHGIGFNRCRNIRLEGFKVREMPFWTIHVFHSDDVLCRRLDLSNHIGNSDGIDIDSTRHVLIEDCQLDQADDGFVMKSGRDHDGRRLGRATEDVVVRNCRIRFAHVLLGCGSELSGGIRNISLHDCTLTDCYKGFYVKTNPGRGGFVENVWFRNVHVRSCAQLVAVKTSVSIGLPDAELCLTRIRGIHAENVSCRTADVGILLMGDARLPVRDVSLKNVHVEAVSSAFKQIENVDDLHEEDVSFGNGRADISDNPESRRIVFWGDAVPEALPAQEREKVDRGVYVFDFSRGRGTWQQAAEALRPRDCLFVKTKCAADAEELVRAARSRASWVLDDIREVPQDFYRSEVRDPHLNRVPLRLFASRPRTETLLDGADWNVPVPHTWNVEDGSDGQDVPPDALCNQSAMRSSYRRGPFTYVRALPPMPLWPRRYFLAFEGASAKTIVRVNGREVGRHDGAFTSFCFEITEALRPDTNRLEVVVDNTYDPEGLPVNADYTMQGGLYRSVRLLDCPVACIDPRVPVRIETDCDSGTATAHYVFTTPAGDFKRTQSARYPRFERWNPDVPALYRFELKDGADRLSLPFGFRTAEFRGGYFHMNGKRIFLKGVNRHQDRAGKGWALSAEDEDEDVRLMKEMGCNAVRTSHYPQSRAFLDACDRLGLIVWSEMPLVDLVTPTEAFRTNLLTVTTEAVEQQYNHPSVCLWSAYNELYNFLTPPMPDGTAEPYVESVVARIRELDRLRPTVCGSNQRTRKSINLITDEFAMNLYPGWYGSQDPHDGMAEQLEETFAANGKSFAVSEYGGGACVEQHDDALNRPEKPGGRWHPEEYQACLHWGNYKAIAESPHVWGAFVWCMFDFAADCRQEGYRLGCNDKGLVTADRRTRKDAFYFYQANWRPDIPVLHLTGRRRTTTRNATTSVLGFCNRGDVTLTVNGRVVGRQTPDAVCTVLWKDVALAVGVNLVRLECGDFASESCLTREK